MAAFETRKRAAMRIARAAARVVLTGAVAGALAGCAAAGFEAAYLIRDEQAYQENIAAAQRGDPAALYEVGKSRCCGLDDGDDVYYDTRAATTWLCASARQGYAPAMAQLGRIYAGEALEGFRFIRGGLRTLDRAGDGRATNPAIAYVWFEKARAAGAPKAGIDAHAQRRRLSEREWMIARALLDTAGPTPCVWDDVMDPNYRGIFEAPAPDA